VDSVSSRSRIAFTHRPRSLIDRTLASVMRSVGSRRPRAFSQSGTEPVGRMGATTERCRRACCSRSQPGHSRPVPARLDGHQQRGRAHLRSPTLANGRRHHGRRRWARGRRSEHFETALKQAHELPHKIAQPEVRRWYARMLRDHKTPGGLDKARTLLGSSRKPRGASGAEFGHPQPQQTAWSSRHDSRRRQRRLERHDLAR
jgi:hypothetical protein